MKLKTDRRVKIGIIGCGAIGSRIAKSIKKDFKKDCLLTGLYDIDPKTVDRLSKSLSYKKGYHNVITMLWQMNKQP